jgi:hypothetical protein
MVLILLVVFHLIARGGLGSIYYMGGLIIGRSSRVVRRLQPYPLNSLFPYYKSYHRSLSRQIPLQTKGKIVLFSEFNLLLGCSCEKKKEG